MSGPGTIAVLDFGKTNAKVSVCDDAGTVIESLSVPTASLPGPPWLHHDLRSMSDWVFSALAGLCRRHPVAHVVPAGHGSGGVLVADDPDLNGDGAALPMIDYEQQLPPGVEAGYAPLAGTFSDRGSAIMMASTHSARQLYWMQAEQPGPVSRARWYLNVAQYWAWRLSGVAVSEVSAMGAQSHFWNVPGRRWAPIVEAMGWGRLMPPFAAAWSVLGPIRPDLAARHGLPAGIAVHAGGHDSSLNFYRYLAAGLNGFTLSSTGTWIVSLSDRADISRLDEHRGMTCNAGLGGQPVGGALTMGGREFSRVAGPRWRDAAASVAALGRIVDQGTFALASFGAGDGQFPGTAGKGRIAGPAPVTADESLTLAILYAALLTVECAASLGQDGCLVLDGTFLNEPLFAPLVAALWTGGPVLASAGAAGVSAGAALLVGHETRTRPAPLPLAAASPMTLPALSGYAVRWRSLCDAQAAFPSG